jgi:hypothetical protein
MEEEILKEIKALKSIIAQVIGSSELPAKQKFSKEAIAKAAKEFEKLSIERGEWLVESDIHKVIRKSPWRAGKFIIEKFGFTNYFTRGRYVYFNRKDLVALNAELKKRNIDLSRYMELDDDKEKFRKYIETLKDPKKSKKRQRFKIPDDLKDIVTYPYHHPPRELVENHIETLKQEFEKYKMVEYVDIYGGTHAMFKQIYYWDKYVNPEIKKRCQNWCSQFNYANEALRLIKQVKSQVIY